MRKNMVVGNAGRVLLPVVMKNAQDVDGSSVFHETISCAVDSSPLPLDSGVNADSTFRSVTCGGRVSSSVV